MSFQRPDELASEVESERNRRFDQGLLSGGKKLLNVAATATGLGISSKILPFLSKYIPVDLAVKGISKISPQLGNFLKKGQSAGLDIKEGLDFIKEKLTPSQQEEQPSEIKALENKNNKIQELFDLASRGKTQGNQFLKHASHLIKSQDIPDYETFSNFYKWWHGQPSERRGSPRAEFELFRQQIGNTLQPQQQEQSQQQPQQSGQGQQALMAILQKLQQSRGGK